METLAKLSKAIDRFSEWLGNAAVYIILLTVSIGFLNVVLRYLGRFTGTQLTSNRFIETQWYLYSLVFFLGFPYILKNGINVRVDFWFGKQSKKRQATIDLIGHFIALIPFCLIGLWVTYSPVLRSWGLLTDGTWGTWEISPDPDGWPRAPIKSMILVAFSTLLLQALSEVIKLVAILREKEALIEVAKHDAPIRVE